MTELVIKGHRCFCGEFLPLEPFFHCVMIPNRNGFRFEMSVRLGNRIEFYRGDAATRELAVEIVESFAAFNRLPVHIHWLNIRGFGTPIKAL